MKHGLEIEVAQRVREIGSRRLISENDLRKIRALLQEIGIQDVGQLANGLMSRMIGTNLAEMSADFSGDDGMPRAEKIGRALTTSFAVTRMETNAAGNYGIYPSEQCYNEIDGQSATTHVSQVFLDRDNVARFLKEFLIISDRIR